MKKTTVMIVIKARQEPGVSVKESYEKFVAKMSDLDGPFGFKGVDTTVIPTFGKNPIASMKIRYPNKSLKFVGGYVLRSNDHAVDKKSRDDDFIWIGFKMPNNDVDYIELIHVQLPKIIQYFSAYRATLDLNDFYSAYCGGYIYTEDGVNGFDANGNRVENNLTFNELSKDCNIDIDGRNNIFGLRAVQYWSAELCNLALNFGPEEVAIRMNGKVPKVELTENGVYLVLSEDPYMKFEDFLRINKDYKKILGLP